MPKRESFVERHNVPRDSKDMDFYYKIYNEAIQGKPRLTKKDIKRELDRIGEKSYPGQRKIEYIRKILEPVDNARIGSTKKAESADRAVSLRDSFDLYQELATLYEQRNDSERASEAWTAAATIAEKARAKNTAKRLYSRAAQSLKKMGPNGRIFPIRNQLFERAEDYEGAAEASEEDYRKLKESEKSNGMVRYHQGNAIMYYELAGKYRKALDLGLEDGRISERSHTHARLRKKSGLEKISAAAAIIGLFGGAIFLSSNITGNVIGLNQTSSNWIGTALFIIGLIGAFAYFRKN